MKQLWFALEIVPRNLNVALKSCLVYGTNHGFHKKSFHTHTPTQVQSDFNEKKEGKGTAGVRHILCLSHACAQLLCVHHRRQEPLQGLVALAT